MLIWLLACRPDAPPTAVEPTLDPALEAWCPGDAAAIEARIDGLIADLTDAEKVGLMAGDGFPLANGAWPEHGIPSRGIPPLQLIDGPRGVSSAAGEMTSFPVGMARGATWDPDLEREVGAAIGREVRAIGASVLLAPTINVLRHPRWGRAQETYGESPVHIGAMGTAFVQGAQQHVLASVKHLAANSIEDTRYEVSVTLEPRVLREVYLPHFRQVVQEGRVASVMTAYNRVNGVYSAESAELLGILHDEWGFQGFVESDWVFGTRSTLPSLDAGLHLEMPNGQFYGDALLEALQDGSADATRVDDAARRLLRARLCFGLDTEPPVPDASIPESPEHVALARRVATEAVVLLKNDGALPLAGSVAVLGPLADAPNLGDVGSSATRSSHVVTVLEGLQAVGATFLEPDDAALATYDTAVVVVGLSADEEGEAIGPHGDRVGLDLPPAHLALLEQVAAAHPRVVVVLIGGAAITAPWEPDVEGLIMAWYPGMEGGHAVADVLTGAANPSGRLPHAWPVAEADLPPFDNTSLEVAYGPLHGQTWLDATGVPAHWPLGFGLSYTTFDYGSQTVADLGESWEVAVEVENTGAVAGAEVVQVYGSVPGSAWERPEALLVGFARVELATGERTTVRIEVPKHTLDVWDGTAWVREEGAVLVAAPHAGG
ncbi:MAG: glycoside hydrolase family 3 C-terminal domain-containing protein [Alphaproteobacteria bacterium]|nr:glycoside hydrolase family 3 C-terminal domain-containing protein [Alphaproteobacteria bacterium]